ncbi:gamma-glutamyltransferase [Pseudemcibacter aquimaris]|uniref:gamma-glutamyltransferase n=1 Tax=Pseudemcibacter aquimaris TaxID=2857064 RepID=UPI002013B5E0|nr:gamma-glutamyltransferase [Pseudemcibacter aquimaris]MCC3860242.1 gamma-glutamyltransferase [Pseudemcibacter aquimaris]WDU57567.1 gamma-glutamyltransferase [Pseudemcibacter aquimaris]
MKKLFANVMVVLAFVIAPLTANAQDLSTLIEMMSGKKVEYDHKMPNYTDVDGFVPQIATNGMVSARDNIATKVGADILAKGGNAVDAAVAVAFALAVVHPEAGNIGGGGFMMIHMAEQDLTTTIDYREVAAGAATHDLYVENGELNPMLSMMSRKSVGVPGTVAGMAMAAEKYGTMSLSELIEPAYRLANDGFPINFHMEKTLATIKNLLINDPEGRITFYKEDGSTYKYGEILKQKNLATSLKQIMEQGPDAFYKGDIARKIVADQEANGGIITMNDMAAYKAIERKPVFGTYKGYELATMPPPSSGGIHIIQMMNMLEHDDLKSMGHNSAAVLHLYIEAMRQAYADRSKYAGDPAFYDVPVEKLIDKEYAKELRAKFPTDRARKSSEVAPTEGLVKEGNHTTHFSVMDKDGNAVSNTYTINYGFYMGMMAKGTGIALNNELDDFDHLPYEPDENGNISGKANAQEPFKRPRSSMSPTIVFKDGTPYLVTGSPGGPTIINTVFQTIMNVLEFDMNITAASSKARIHHSWMPDEIWAEKSLSVDTFNILQGMGHNIKSMRDGGFIGFKTLGQTNSIMYKDGYFYGASDPRTMDSGTVGLNE